MSTELTTNNIKIFSYMTGCMEHEGITPTEFTALTEILSFMNSDCILVKRGTYNGKKEYYTNLLNVDSRNQTDRFKCSGCGCSIQFPHYQSLDDIIDYSYCPYCGKRVKDSI